MNKLKECLMKVLNNDKQAEALYKVFTIGADAIGGDGFARATIENVDAVELVEVINELIGDDIYQTSGQFSTLSVIMDILKNPKFDDDELNAELRDLYNNGMGV